MREWKGIMMCKLGSSVWYQPLCILWLPLDNQREALLCYVGKQEWWWGVACNDLLGIAMSPILFLLHLFTFSRINSSYSSSPCSFVTKSRTPKWDRHGHSLESLASISSRADIRMTYLPPFLSLGKTRPTSGPLGFLAGAILVQLMRKKTPAHNIKSSHKQDSFPFTPSTQLFWPFIQPKRHARDYHYTNKQ